MLKIVPLCKEDAECIELQRPYAVLLVGHGEGLLRINNRAVELLPGRVFFLKREQQMVMDGDLLTGQLIEFQEAMLRAFLIQFAGHRDKGLYVQDIELPFVDLQQDRIKYFLQIIGLLNLEMDEGASVTIFMHLLFILLRHINRDVERFNALSLHREKILLKLVLLIEAHYKESRKTSFYAFKMGMSDRELNNFTHEVYGKKFFNVLMERILAEVDVLLLSGNRTIKEIAYELKFAHHAHLNVYYKRFKGSTPVEFRKRRR